MIELPSLYEHQNKFRDELRTALSKHRAVIGQAPPGFGKSRTAKNIIGSYVNRPKRDDESGKCLFAVYRRGLVDNASNSFRESPELPHGIIMAGRPTSPQATVQVASIDTLLAWYCENGSYVGNATFDFIIYDETDNACSKLKAYLAAHGRKRKALGLREPFLLGLTATPEAKELADLYREIVPGPPTKWLIENGFLKSFRYFSCKKGRLDLLKKSAATKDGFTVKSVGAAMAGLAGDLVRDWRKHAEGRATVGFFPLLAHAKEAEQELLRHGIRATYVDGKTPDDERQQIFDDLNAGHIDYICNVGVVDRGTDIPFTSCIQVCTAVNKRNRWLQMVGRGSRNHPGIMDCIVLDHGGNLGNERGMPLFEDAVDWMLENTADRQCEAGAKPKIECPSCGAVYRGGTCQHCGYEPTARERKSQGLEFDGSELVEIKASSKVSKKVKSNEQLLTEALYRCGRSNRVVAQAFGIAASEARKQGTMFTAPSHIVIAGSEYKVVPYGHADRRRRVGDVYGFTTGDYSRDSNPYRVHG